MSKPTKWIEMILDMRVYPPQVKSILSWVHRLKLRWVNQTETPNLEKVGLGFCWDNHRLKSQVEEISFTVMLALKILSTTKFFSTHVLGYHTWWKTFTSGQGNTWVTKFCYERLHWHSSCIFIIIGLYTYID